MNTRIAMGILIGFFYSFHLSAQTTPIPDPVFEGKLVQLGIDNQVDGQISNAAAASVTTLQIWNSNISDLTGIEAFVNLDSLACNGNNLTQLDFSNNPLLETLDCGSNQLTSLNITQNAALTRLWCGGNQLASIDLSGNPLLDVYVGPGNPMTTLDFSAVTFPMTVIQCNACNLTDIYLPPNMGSLNYLLCANNNLSHLDLRGMMTTGMGPFILEATQNLPYMTICLPSLSVVQTIPGPWDVDNTAIYNENCGSELAATGKVVFDDNFNCLPDTNELRLQYKQIKFDNGVNQYYAVTRPDGSYEAYVDTGSYTATLMYGNHPYITACPASQNITVTAGGAAQQLDFMAQPTTLCPYMDVNIGTPRLRRCFAGNFYDIMYCNTGTATANNAYIEVEIDTTLYFINSSIPVASQNGNVYTFNLGNVDVGDCGHLSIEVEVSCHANLGDVHCLTAHVYPEPCNNAQPDIQISDSCSVDSIFFFVHNFGATAPGALSYILLEDSMIVDTGTIVLGSSATVAYPTTANSFYQLVVGVGNNSYYTATEPVNCDNGTLRNNALYPITHVQDYIDTDCTENRGSYDPNDKVGYPLGFSSNHYIAPNIPIDYRIRFQNTGTDTAIFINVYDTLSTHLDISTFQMGAVSHPYTVDFLAPTPAGEPVVRFRFNPIYLPDSNVNEPASNGYIHYRIAQKPNLPNGTVINNSASIYFDFNSPIKTNTTVHTVCDNCLPIIVSVDNIEDQAYQVKAIPNPFTTSTTITLTGYEANTAPLTLQVYDAMGRMIQTLESNTAQFVLERKDLPSGLYFFRITDGNTRLKSGRLIAQ